MWTPGGDAMVLYDYTFVMMTSTTKAILSNFMCPFLPDKK